MDLTKQSPTPHSTQPSLCQSYVRSVFIYLYSYYEYTCSFCVEITGGHARQTGQETFSSLPRLHLQGMWSLDNINQQAKTRVRFSCACWILSTASACCKSSSNINVITQQAAHSWNLFSSHQGWRCHTQHTAATWVDERM